MAALLTAPRGGLLKTQKEEVMPPLIDRNSLELLLQEEKNFVICTFATAEPPSIFKTLFQRFSSSVLILLCAQEELPQIYRHAVSESQGALLFFCRGTLIDVVCNLNADGYVLKRVESFVKFTQVVEGLLLRESIFQRSRKKINYLLEVHYSEMGGLHENC